MAESSTASSFSETFRLAVSRRTRQKERNRKTFIAEKGKGRALTTNRLRAPFFSRFRYKTPRIFFLPF